METTLPDPTVLKRAPRHSGRFEERIDSLTGERHLVVHRRGADLKSDPFLNKGTCFPIEERHAFHLQGLVPPMVGTLAEQESRAYGNYLEAGDDLRRYLFLTGLQDRNETLFYRLLADHIEEMAPVVYTPTVGRACETYSHIYRRPRGLYITPNDRGHIEEILRHAPVELCRVIVATDNEAILGLGDLGVGGMGIPIGKLTLYTAGAGIHPTSCLPIDLDVGTDNQALLSDPLYLGLRQPRLRGEAYFSLLDEFVDAVNLVFPKALVQWEDFANDNAFEILERYRDRVLSFDDDIQGTASVVLAGIRTALTKVNRPLTGERIVLHGVGAAGGGSARLIRLAMEAEGLSPAETAQRVLCLDSKGLLLDDRPGLTGHKLELAAPRSVTEGWPGERFDLATVVKHFRPTILIGMSGQTASFTEEIVRSMHDGCTRPVIFPLSNPNSRAEATPTQLLRWTAGHALVATGSPFPAVELAGQTYGIGQANNVLAFPGIGLGAIAARATRIPDEAFLAASDALVECAPKSTLAGEPLFPPIRNLRAVSRIVARATAQCLVRCGAAEPLDDHEIEQRLAALIWEPQYLPYVAEDANG